MKFFSYCTGCLVRGCVLQLARWRCHSTYMYFTSVLEHCTKPCTEAESLTTIGVPIFTILSSNFPFLGECHLDDPFATRHSIEGMFIT